MDFASIFDSVKEKITDFTSPIIEKLQELMEANKKLFFAVTALIFVILVCIILLIFSVSAQNSKKKAASKIPEPEILGVNTPVIPDGPKLPKDYNISRPAKENWTEEESEEWFTVPGKNEIDSLSFSNDKIVNDILEAAP